MRGLFTFLATAVAYIVGYHYGVEDGEDRLRKRKMREARRVRPRSR